MCVTSCPKLYYILAYSERFLFEYRNLCGSPLGWRLGARELARARGGGGGGGVVAVDMVAWVADWAVEWAAAEVMAAEVEKEPAVEWEEATEAWAAAVG